ncbi:hypothetical protein TWF694_007277 [Orbilia ellipsospora]|uniref:Uncharacterized protein n=1 Tax=Orbilia ellipsospora TaxID=2528407 RepID=A0AAV9XHR5_9PEZI
MIIGGCEEFLALYEDRLGVAYSVNVLSQQSLQQGTASTSALPLLYCHHHPILCTALAMAERASIANSKPKVENIELNSTFTAPTKDATAVQNVEEHSSIFGLAASSLQSVRSILSRRSFNTPRRPALSPGTYDANTPPTRRVSAGSSYAKPQVDTQHAIGEPGARILASETPLFDSILTSPTTSLADQQESRKFNAADIRRQLESYSKAPSRNQSAPSSRSSSLKLTDPPSWSINLSSITIRQSQPVQSITTHIWEPPTDEVPEPVHMKPSSSDYKSKYVSFPPFESYPKISRPSLRTRCSDKPWFLIQKLTGKIAEIHNSGQSSSRSNSEASTPSRKSSRSPGRPQKSNRVPNIPSQRRSSDPGGSSHPSLNPTSRKTQQKASTVTSILKSSTTNRKSVPDAPESSFTADTGIEPDRGNQDSTKHVRIDEPASDQTHNEEKGKGTLRRESASIADITQGIASTLLNLVTMTKGESPTLTLTKSTNSETAHSPINIKAILPESEAKRTYKETVDTASKHPDDSSEDEMSFMEYVKRFSDASPPNQSRMRRSFSNDQKFTWKRGSYYDEPQQDTIETVPRSLTLNTARFLDLNPARSLKQQHKFERMKLSSPTPLTPVTEDVEVFTLDKDSITLPSTTQRTKDEPEFAKYRARDFEIINEYFFKTQSRLLRQKWPFLLDNEVQYLVENKWLEMEEGDIKRWAKESAMHIDEEGYIEPDFFADITLTDPRAQPSSHPG